MRWRQPADRVVVEAVVAVFREPEDRATILLAPLKEAQWRRSLYWLDASGMALYLLDRLERLDALEVLPKSVLDRLQQNQKDNRRRSEAMLAEFVEINQAFQAVGVSYANEKGFTLWPDSCPDPALRCQLDLDFLVDGNDLEICAEILCGRGYTLRTREKHEWGFRAADDNLAKVGDLYKPKPQRSAELHFTVADDLTYTPSRDPRLDRAVWKSQSGLAIPCLDPVDQLIAQASHILEHLCTAGTRLAWLLEYKRHVAVHAEDGYFWTEVRVRARDDRRTAIAIGLASLISNLILGGGTPPALDDWTLDRLPPAVRLWAELYGRRSVLADPPGTKLYLLLRDQLDARANAWKEDGRHILLPLRWPARIVNVGKDASPWKRLQGELYQFRFLLYRLRFRVVEGIRYNVEAAKWKRQLRLLNQSQHQEALFAATLTNEAND